MKQTKIRILPADPEALGKWMDSDEGRESMRKVFAASQARYNDEEPLPPLARGPLEPLEDFDHPPGRGLAIGILSALAIMLALCAVVIFFAWVLPTILRGLH
jgi:hypothetical protein